MKFVKTILTSLSLILFLSNGVTAQSSILEIEANYMLSSEKLKPNRKQFFYSDQLHHSYGINGRITFENNIFIKSGLQFRQFGTSFILNEKSEDPDILPTTNWSASRIDIPMNVGYYFINSNILRIGASVGLSNGILLNQTQTSEGKQTDIDVYEKYMINHNASLEIGVKIEDRIFLNITPTWQRQLNLNFSEFRSYYQVGFGCQFGLSYQLNSPINKTEIPALNH